MLRLLSFVGFVAFTCSCKKNATATISAKNLPARGNMSPQVRSDLKNYPSDVLTISAFPAGQLKGAAKGSSFGE